MAKKKKHRKKSQRHSSRGAIATPAGSRPSAAVGAAVGAASSTPAATSKAKARPQSQPPPPATAKLPASGAPALVAAASTGQTAGRLTTAGAAQPRPDAARWSYVGKDVRRVGALALACIIIEAIVWYLFSHTGVGPAIINHITI